MEPKDIFSIFSIRNAKNKNVCQLICYFYVCKCLNLWSIRYALIVTLIKTNYFYFNVVALHSFSLWRHNWKKAIFRKCIGKAFLYCFHCWYKKIPCMCTELFTAFYSVCKTLNWTIIIIDILGNILVIYFKNYVLSTMCFNKCVWSGLYKCIFYVLKTNFCSDVDMTCLRQVGGVSKFFEVAGRMR